MNWRIAISLLLLSLLTAGCNRAAAPAAAPAAADTPTETSARTGGTPMDPRINPHIVPPPVIVKVDPNLAAVPTPEGWLSQSEIQAKAIAAVAANKELGGTLTLTSIQWGNGMWVAEFATDGRQLSGPHSHPAPVGGPRDPVEQRKAATSDVRILSAVDYSFDGPTGEMRGGGFKATAPDLNRPDLEHYVGRIVDAGMNFRLRLTNPDGSREGRDLDVWVPQEALGSSLALWQLQYGAGRQIEVWGLTGGSGRVAAYRLTMADPPPAELLQVELVGNVPVYPGAVFGPDPDGWASLTLHNTTLSEAWAWYAREMPHYGWHSPAIPPDGPPAGGNLGRRSFQSDAWEQVTLEITPVPEGVRVRINRSAP